MLPSVLASLVLFLTFLFIPGIAGNAAERDPRYACFRHLESHEHEWKMYNNLIVAEVVRAQSHSEYSGECGIGSGSRKVKYRVLETLKGDLTTGSEIEVYHQWCYSYKEVFYEEARFVVGVHECRGELCAGDFGIKAYELSQYFAIKPGTKEQVDQFLKCFRGKGKEK